MILDQLAKDIIQIMAWVVAMVAGTIAAYRGLQELRLNREQRKLELKWNKAKLAKEIVNGFEDKEPFRTAHHMLAWNAREYQLASGERVTIDFSMVMEALRTENLKFSDTKKYIRECLIFYFDAISRLEHYIRRDLVDFEDVRLLFEYAMGRIQPEREVVKNYLAKYHPDGLALGFLNRYDPG